METETAATVATLLPHNACLSATDIETAAILLQADTRTDHRKGQASFVFKPTQSKRVGRVWLISLLLGVLLNNGVLKIFIKKKRCNVWLQEIRRKMDGRKMQEVH